MRNHYMGLLVIGILVFIVVAVGFFLVGTPISQRAIKYDDTRLSDFSTLRYRIENYYDKNQKLPQNLAELKTDTGYNSEELKTTDPETQKEYTYEIVTSSSYKLCTTFSTDSEEVKKKYSYKYYSYDTKTAHKNGYDCIAYTIPDYYLNKYQERIIQPRIILESPSPATGPAQ